MPIQTSINNQIRGILKLLSEQRFTIQFINAFQSKLEWAPTADRTLVLPDRSGLVGMDSRLIAASTGVASANRLIKTDITGKIDHTLKPSIGARVYNTSQQSIPDATATPIAFSLARYDTNSIFDSTRSTTRLFCKTPGYYFIGGSIRMTGAMQGGTVRSASIWRNSAQPLATHHVDAAANQQGHVTVDTIYYLNTNDYVELVAYQNSETSLSVVIHQNASPEFYMHRLS